MDPLIAVYLILGFTMLIAFIIIILKVAGKEMFFAFFRFFSPKGADIFLVSPSNNHVSQYYKVAKDGHFLIDNHIYLTNPYKLKGLNADMVKEVQQKMDLTIRSIKTKILNLEKKKDHINKQLESIENKEENYNIIQALSQQYTLIDNHIEGLKGKLDKKTQNYYRLQRPVYFFIEGDPIPKDFFELYTDIDCIQLENIISRAQTKDPNSIQALMKDIHLIKIIVICLIIIGALSLFFAFHSDYVVKELAKTSGVVLSI